MRAVYTLMAVLLLASLAGCGATSEPVAQASPIPPSPVPATVTTAPTETPAPPVATSTPLPATEPTVPPPTPTSAGQVTATLTVEEYEVVDNSVDTPTHFEFKDRIPPAVFDKRRAWREPSFPQMAEQANQVLAPFGYRLEAKPESETLPQRFDLYKDEKLVLADISSFRFPQASADGKDLAMQVDQVSGTPYLVRPTGGEPWDPGQHAYLPPVFAGNQLASLSSANMTLFDVVVGDKVVYSAGPYQPSPENPVKSLSAWNGQWVLELENEVIVDGKSLNQELGYDQIFNWATVKGQPFYFFSKGGRIGVSYAGQVLPVQYDGVAHYQCCEASGFNPGSNQDMIWFYGLRGGKWYYVEMGIYQ